MSSSLCGTGLYANDVLCEVIDKMSQLFEESSTMLETALSAVAAFEEASENSMSVVTEIEYDVDTSGIPSDYAHSDNPVEPDYTGIIPAVPAAPDLPTAPTLTTAPTIPSAYQVGSHAIDSLSSPPDGYDITDHVVTAGPTIPPSYVPTSAPTSISPPAVPAPYKPDPLTVDAIPVVPAGYDLPDADVGLIASSVSDDIFDRASEKLTRAALADSRRASYSLAAKGIGLATASLLMRMKEADQELTDKLSEAALTQSITEGEWSREDAKALHELHIRNWPLKPAADLDSYKAKEGFDISAWEAILNANVKLWDLAPSFELDIYKAQQGLEQDSWKALQDFNIKAWSLKPDLDVEVYKSYEGLKASSHGSDVDAHVKNWPIQYGLEIQAYQAEEPLKVDVFKTTTDAEIRNWPEKPKLDVQVWEASDKLASNLYSTQTNAEATHYQSTVSGYTAQTQAILGEIGESTKRFDSRINLLQNHISSETERRGWSQMQVGAELEQADKAAAFALQKASAILEVNRATTEEVAKLLVGLAQGMWSSLGYSLGGSGSQSVSESV